MLGIKHYIIFNYLSSVAKAKVLQFLISFILEMTQKMANLTVYMMFIIRGVVGPIIKPFSKVWLCHYCAMGKIDFCIRSEQSEMAHSKSLTSNISVKKASNWTTNDNFELLRF